MEKQLALTSRGKTRMEEVTEKKCRRFMTKCQDVIQNLPFVAALQADQTLVDMLGKDLCYVHLRDDLREQLSQAIAHDVSQGYGKDHFSKTTLQLKAQLKAATEAVEEQTVTTTKAIDRHFRQKSRELHPDQHGGDVDAFEALTNAHRVLRKTRLRRLYLEQMLQVAQQVSPLLVETSHHSWVCKNTPSLAEKGMPSRSPLKIQGGVAYDRPKRPLVHVLNRNKRRIQVELQVDPEDLQQVVVMATCPDYKDEVILQSLSKEKVELLQQQQQQEEDPYIRIQASLPEHGVWTIYWHATYRHEERKNKVTTPSSIQVSVDLSSEDQLRHRATIRATDELAKQRAGDIQHVLQKLRGAHFTDNIEKRHQVLHGVMARGRSTLQYLNNLLEADGLLEEKDMNGLVPLQQALDVAMPIKQNLDARYNAVTKKSKLKGFKAHVESLLESGEAADWIRSVSEQELQSLGGTSNRLYQLLVDQLSLELDPATLAAACTRHDLYTPKQCEKLSSLKMEKEEQMSQAAQDAMEQATALEEENKENDDSCKNDDELSPGNIVEISGLSSSKGQLYNDTLGMILQKKGDGRYIVQSQENGHHLSLDVSKLSKWQSHALRDSWQCKACTLLHEGPRSNATFCDACQTPRGEDASFMNDGDLENGDLTTPVKRDDTSSWEEVPSKRASPVKNNEWEAEQPQGASPPQKPSRSTLSDATKKRPPQKVATGLCRFGANCHYVNCKYSHPNDDEVSALTSLSSPVKILAKEANYEKHQFSIPAGIAGWIIGKDATHLFEIRQDSGAMVYIDNSGENRTVIVSGKPKAVARGVKMIKDIVANFVGGKKAKSPTAASATDTQHTSPTVASSTDTLHTSPDDESHVQWRPLSPPMSPWQEQPLLEQSHMTTHDETKESFVTEPGINQNDDAEKENHVEKENQDVPTPADSFVADDDNIPKQADSYSVDDEDPPVQASANASVSPKRVAAPVWQQAVGTQETAADLKPVSLNQVLDQRAIVPKPSNHYVSDDYIPNQAPVKLAKPPGMNGDLTALTEPKPKPSAYHDKGIPKTIRTPARAMNQFYTANPSVPYPRIPAQVQMPPTALKGMLQPTMSNEVSQTTDNALLAFLKEQEACIKGTPQDFYNWLVASESIASLEDLAEAVSDEDYLKTVLKSGDGKVGVKGFKLKAFQKAVTAVVEDGAISETKTQTRPPLRDLMCPISHRLMIKDPVLAADGITYERDAIVAHFQKEQWGLRMALASIEAGQNVDEAKFIADRGIVSPVTGEVFAHLHLVPNHVARSMARNKAGMEQFNV